MGGIIESIGKGESVAEEVYRCAVIAKIYGMTVSGDNVPIKPLPGTTVENIGMESNNRCTGDLIILYGDGAVGTDFVEYIIQKNIDIYEDIQAAKQYILDNNEVSGYDKLSDESIENILKCCAVSKLSEGVSNADFNTVKEIYPNEHVTFYQGAVKITDKKFFEFLYDIDEPMGMFGGDPRTVHPEYKVNMDSAKNAEKLIPESENTPCALDMKNLVQLSKIYGKPYAAEFVADLRRNGIYFDDIETKYGEFIKKKMLHFEICSYKRKRNVCSLTANWFDYSDDAGDTKMTADKHKVIDLEMMELTDTESLTDAAVMEFAGGEAIEENTLLKIIHGETEKYYVIKNKRRIEVNKQKFHTVLFDFNNIWTIIQECAHKGIMRRFDQRIVIPLDIYETIPPDQRKYADELLKVQYRFNEEHKKSNRLLSALKSEAQSEFAKQKEINEAQAALKANQANRKPIKGGKK